MVDVRPWPTDWPTYKQACFGSWDKCCDMLVGPCSCGASHLPGEFELLMGILFRNGERVPTKEDPE